MKKRASWPMKAWEVRAILAGSKTQKRLVVRMPSTASPHGKFHHLDVLGTAVFTDGSLVRCPYGQPGDRLWVREAFALSVIDPDGLSPEDDPENYDVIYRAAPEQPGGGWADSDGNKIPAPWKPSIHMPRWASRILLEIVSVRVERLQDISEEDARAEGILDGGCLNCGESEPCGCSNPQPDARDSFFHLWMSINGEQSLHENPWVWAIAFKRVTP